MEPINLTIYKEAVAELAVPKLTAFLKAQIDIVEIDGWAALRAPEKRQNMMEALGQSKPLREQFVAFYAETTGKDADFSEWETPAPATDAAPATAPDNNDEQAPVAEVPDEALQGEAEAAGAIQSKAEQPAPTGTAVGAPAPAPAPHVSVFVEGAFEQIVADVAGLDAQASKANLIDAEDRMEFEHVRIGALLSHIQKSQHYITLGYDNLREFLDAETGLHYRKATYLISNYDAVKELGIPAEHLKGVTWSALRHVIPVLTTKNYKKWLEAARSTTHVALIEQVTAEKAKQAGALPAPAGTAPEAPKTSNKTFALFPDQETNVAAAIEKAKTAANVDSNSAALDIIAAAYTGAPVSDATVGNVMPDTSPEGFKKIFTKLQAEGGNQALLPILEAIGEVWGDVDITVAFPDEAQAAE